MGDKGDATEEASAAAATTSAATAAAGAKRRRRRRLGLLAALPLLAVLAVVLANVAVTRSATGHTYDAVAQVPARTVAIVFGAGVGPDGKPSPMLTDRLDAAVELYRAGTVGKLLMTGDNSRADYDEVTAMRDAATAAGVPAEDITRDYAGFDSYDSCARAVSVFEVRDAVLVTQDYHLSRALFLCRDAGIDAVGYRVPDWQHRPETSPTAYPPDLARSYMTREWFARVKAVIEAKITRPGPRLGGPPVGLTPT